MEVERTIRKASSAYSTNSNLRATVQLIPYIGGSLDTLISGKGTEIQQKRIEEFLSDTSNRLSRLEGKFDPADNEELFDLFTNMIDGVVRTRSKQKKAYFASILCNKLTRKDSWEEAEIATRILKEIDVVHVLVLNYSSMLKTVDNPFDREQVFSVNERFRSKENLKSIPYLGSNFPEYSPAVLDMACSELVAKSLLQDAGLGGIAMGAMDFCSPTENTKWFVDWVCTK